MQDNPLISVMILTYNHEAYVRQAVEGAMMQECEYPFEIVISDDCSADNTREVCLQLQEEYPEKIRLIFNEQNKGVIRNYFETMQQCHGKYIADCSGDDYWIDKTKLQKQVDILEQREDIILVYTNWKDLTSRTGKIVDDSKSRKNNFKKEILSKEDYHAFLNQKGYSIVNINTSCFRKEEALAIYHEYPQLFDIEKCPYEDFQLLFLLLTKGNFYYLDEEMGVYRNNDNSVGRSTDLSRYFMYQYKDTILRMDLSKEFSININSYLAIQSSLLFTLAFKARNSRFAKMAKKLLTDFGYRLRCKEELLYIISTHKLLEVPVYQLYLFLRKTKHSFKG